MGSTCVNLTVTSAICLVLLGLIIGFTGVGIYVHNDKQFDDPAKSNCTIISTELITAGCSDYNYAAKAYGTKPCYTVSWLVTYDGKEPNTTAYINEKNMGIGSARKKMLKYYDGLTHQCWYDKSDSETVRWYCTCEKFAGEVLLILGWSMFGVGAIMGAIIIFV